MAFSTKQSQIVLRIQVLRRFGGTIDTVFTREVTTRTGPLTRRPKSEQRMRLRQRFSSGRERSARAGDRFNQDLNLLCTAGYSGSNHGRPGFGEGPCRNHSILMEMLFSVQRNGGRHYFPPKLLIATVSVPLIVRSGIFPTTARVSSWHPIRSYQISSSSWK